MTSSVMIIRTHRWNDALETWAYRLLNETGKRIVVAADETRGSLKVPDAFEKLSVSVEIFKSMGLFTPPDVMWRCGDYNVIAVREMIGDAEDYWLIEDDVRINCFNVGEFTGAVDQSDIDFTAIGFREADAAWPWFKTITPFFKKAYKCLFPLTRFSSRAVALLADGRRDLTAQFTAEGRSEEGWPNDESFAATKISASTLSAEDFLMLVPEAYSEKTISWRKRPFSDQEVRTLQPDHKIYHPVLSGANYVRSLRSALAAMREEGQSGVVIREHFREAVSTWIALEEDCAQAKLFRELTNVSAAVASQAALRAPKKMSILDGRIVEFVIAQKSVLFFVCDKSDYIQTYHARGRFYEDVELGLIGKFFPRGGAFLDIGAHLGNHSIYVGGFLSPRSISVCEPNPNAARILLYNLKLNDLTQICDVSGLNFGLSDAVTERTLVVSKTNSGDAYLAAPGTPGMTISLRRGDDHYKGQKFDFVKIDVGMHVASVLKGMSGLISEHKPILGIQISDRVLSEVFDLLMPMGYQEVTGYRRYPGGKFYILAADGQVLPSSDAVV